MKAGETLRIAGRSIRAHRLRSTLTVLGVVIGIASVIVFATFGASVQADVVGGIGETNANNMFVTPAENDSEGPGGFGAAGRPLFTDRDVAGLGQLEGVQAVIPQGLAPVSAVGNRTISQDQAIATVPETFEGEYIVAGESFEPGTREIVINRAAAELFDGNDTVGSTIQLTLTSGNRTNVTVAGVTSGTRGVFSTDFGEESPQFYLPVDPFYTTSVRSPSVSGADVPAYPLVTVVADPSRVNEVQGTVETYMTEESDASELLPEGFEINVQTSGDIADQIEEVIGQITRFVTGIAVISLVVGAIGIANITLVSVTERTRQIGIMKAVGARNRDVLQLFLTEAILLGALGAGVGVPLGLGVGFAATVYADVGFALAPEWLAFSVLMGVSVGVVAGLYPAWRASKIDPIDALRYE